MSTFTIKNFPNGLLKRLREEAGSARRSVTQEVLTRLEASLVEPAAVKRTASSYSSVGDQVEAWMALSGKWKSKLTVKEEIEQLYKARKRGRKVKF